MIMYSGPFTSFFTPQNRSEPDALLGFELPSLPTASMTSAAKQLRLVKDLWNSQITGLEIRFVTTPDLKTSIYLLCRIRRPPQTDRKVFQNFCANVATHIVRLYKDCGYQLQPITSERLLIQALAPFQIQALAEVRRCEEIEVLYDAFAEYEVYVPYSWEWAIGEQLAFFDALTQQHSPGLVSIHLEPTMLYQQEKEHLQRANSRQMRDLLCASGPRGEEIYQQYRIYEQRLHQPYLLRICLAFPVLQPLARLGQEILNQIQPSAMPPMIQYPQNPQEWQAALYNLRYLEWLPWGNRRADTPDTARLRYLVDSQGASMGFHLPVAPDPMSGGIKVLLIFANPYQQYKPLRLGMNDRIIQEAIHRSRYRDNISLTIHHAATIHDLRHALLDEEFQIVHIAGHGVHEGLTLEDEVGVPHHVPPQALAALFRAYSATLQCILLNACYSEAQGALIAPDIPFTIAMEGELGDNEALEFSRGFYDALGSGKGVELAYQEGCLCVDLVITDKKFRPKLFKKL